MVTENRSYSPLDESPKVTSGDRLGYHECLKGMADLDEKPIDPVVADGDGDVVCKIETSLQGPPIGRVSPQSKVQADTLRRQAVIPILSAKLRLSRSISYDDGSCAPAHQQEFDAMVNDGHNSTGKLIKFADAAACVARSLAVQVAIEEGLIVLPSRATVKDEDWACIKGAWQEKPGRKGIILNDDGTVGFDFHGLCLRRYAQSGVTLSGQAYYDYIATKQEKMKERAQAAKDLRPTGTQCEEQGPVRGPM